MGKSPGSQNSLHPAEASGGRGSWEQAPKKESLVGRELTWQVWGAAAPPAGLGAPSTNDLALRLAELRGAGERDVGLSPRGCVGGCSWKDVACDRDGELHHCPKPGASGMIREVLGGKKETNFQNHLF